MSQHRDDRRDTLILRELYGGSDIQRFYIHQGNVNKVMIKENVKWRLTNLLNFFMLLFLPQGYPHSVSRDYIAYQKWDTAQAFCSSVAGVLATQEILRGVGVGNAAASTLAATVTWVYKEGVGHIGKLLFSFSHGNRLDAYSKRWRLFADFINDLALTIEMTLPAFPGYTTTVLCVSSLLKAIVGIAGGATRVALTQHHALRGNMADVAAKDNIQETAVNLLAGFVGVFVINFVGWPRWIFALMVVLHLVCNYYAVCSVCLCTLNEPRFIALIRSYLLRKIVPEPKTVNRYEPILFMTRYTAKELTAFDIKIGHSLAEVLNRDSQASELKGLTALYKKLPYIIYPDLECRKMYVLMRGNANGKAVLGAYYHAVVLAIIVCTINEHRLNISDNGIVLFTILNHMIGSTVLFRDRLEPRSACGFTRGPSNNLIRALNDHMELEWAELNRRMTEAGWVCHRHVLLMDEWTIKTNSRLEERSDIEYNPGVIESAMDASLQDIYYNRELDNTSDVREADAAIRQFPQRNELNHRIQDDLLDGRARREEEQPQENRAERHRLGIEVLDAFGGGSELRELVRRRSRIT